MSLILRKHQFEFGQIVEEIRSGKPINRIVAYVVPGGGKSLFSLLCWPLIKYGHSNSICWVVPRLTLAYQAELNAIDPFFKKELNHGMIIRAATNEYNPRRNCTGYTTTYQAIGQDSNFYNVREFEQRKYILILDENHHIAADNGQWHKSISPLVERCNLLILLSGTLNRGDEDKIAFMDYEDRGNNICLDLSENDYTRVIRYTRSDALKEKAILPIKFTLFDGDVEWERKGKEFKTKLSKAYEHSGDAIQTALNTAFGNHIMKNGFDHWIEYKKYDPGSKIAIVAANIKHAKSLLSILKDWGFNPLIATSDDSLEALKAIKEYRFGSCDTMVFCGMCSEGLDVPEMTHIIVLTHFRTEAYIEQLVSRAVRVNKKAGPYESQVAYIFAPDDPPFRRVVEKIKKEQSNIIVNDSDKSELPEKKRNGRGERGPGITFINGSISGAREISLGEIPSGYTPPPTISEQEHSLRKQIDDHVKSFCRVYMAEHKKVNGEIKTVFKKSRDLMELSELERCYEYVKDFYSLVERPKKKVRKRGRLIPTKAVPWIN